jgi:hypothetical protein
MGKQGLRYTPRPEAPHYTGDNIDRLSRLDQNWIEILKSCSGYRNGRHWVRVELSTILIKYAFKISIQFWSRRDNSVVPLA